MLLRFRETFLTSQTSSRNPKMFQSCVESSECLLPLVPLPNTTFLMSTVCETGLLCSKPLPTALRHDSHGRAGACWRGHSAATRDLSSCPGSLGLVGAAVTAHQTARWALLTRCWESVKASRNGSVGNMPVFQAQRPELNPQNLREKVEVMCFLPQGWLAGGALSSQLRPLGAPQAG